MLARRYGIPTRITSIYTHIVGPTQTVPSPYVNLQPDMRRRLQPLCHKALRPQTTRRAHHLRSALPTQGAENGTSRDRATVGDELRRAEELAEALARRPDRLAVCPQRTGGLLVAP